MKNQPFFFIQMSDPQFGMFPTNGDIFRETQLFEKAISHANRLKPAFVISTGDLVNEPCNEKQLSIGLHTIQKFDKSFPFYLLPGNHDVGDAPTKQTLSWYRKDIGKDWYSFDYAGWHFIGLNSCIISQGRHVLQDVEKQWKWLNDDLKQTVSDNNLNIAVFMHHPLFLDNPEEADDYFNVPRQMRQVYLNLFQKYEIKTIFAGHLHQNNIAADSQLEVVTTGPVGMPFDLAYSGFRIVKVYADSMEHKYFSLDDVINHEL
ncbi:MAG: metallophosphoesterase [Planctomycetota bacterium]|jgi:3',5'-cyclic AMP phosphodiesterase CpdA